MRSLLYIICQVLIWLDTVWALFFILTMTIFLTSGPMHFISLPIDFKTRWKFGDYLDNLFPLSNPGEKKNQVVDVLETELVIQHSKQKNQFYLKLIAEKWHALCNWLLISVFLSGLQKQLCHDYKDILKISHILGFWRDLVFLNRIIEYGDNKFSFGSHIYRTPCTSVMEHVYIMSINFQVNQHTLYNITFQHT